MSSNTQDIDKLREQTVEVATTSKSDRLDLSSEARTVSADTQSFLAGLDRYISPPTTEEGKQSAFERWGPL